MSSIKQYVEDEVSSIKQQAYINDWGFHSNFVFDQWLYLWSKTKFEWNPFSKIRTSDLMLSKIFLFWKISCCIPRCWCTCCIRHGVAMKWKGCINMHRPRADGLESEFSSRSRRTAGRTSERMSRASLWDNHLGTTLPWKIGIRLHITYQWHWEVKFNVMPIFFRLYW